MRKQIIDHGPGEAMPPERRWLDLERLAQVGITSEEADHPIEAALMPGGAGWRAAQPGEQTIRLRFDEPLRLWHIHLLFEEPDLPRTQEFVLRWSADGGWSYRDIVRQQYTFSPPGTVREAEDYDVDLHGVTVLELRIVPHISGGGARASLARLRVA